MQKHYFMFFDAGSFLPSRRQHHLSSSASRRQHQHHLSPIAASRSITTYSMASSIDARAQCGPKHQQPASLLRNETSRVLLQETLISTQALSEKLEEAGPHPGGAAAAELFGIPLEQAGSCCSSNASASERAATFFPWVLKVPFFKS